MSVWAIVPAAGIGQRMGGDVPKQYLPLQGRTILETTLRRLYELPALRQITVMLNPADKHWRSLGIEDNLAALNVVTAVGGSDRHQSVFNGLKSIATEASPADWVLVHDAVRPCVRVSDIQRLLLEVEGEEAGGLLASPVEHTLKKAKVVSNEQNIAVVEKTVDRLGLWYAYTPQVFRYGLLYTALDKVIKEGLLVTDEAAALEASGYQARLVTSSRDNIKITQESDLLLAQMIMEVQSQENRHD